MIIIFNSLRMDNFMTYILDIFLLIMSTFILEQQ